MTHSEDKDKDNDKDKVKDKDKNQNERVKKESSESPTSESSSIRSRLTKLIAHVKFTRADRNKTSLKMKIRDKLSQIFNKHPQKVLIFFIILQFLISYGLSIFGIFMLIISGQFSESGKIVEMALFPTVMTPTFSFSNVDASFQIIKNYADQISQQERPKNHHPKVSNSQDPHYVNKQTDEISQAVSETVNILANYSVDILYATGSPSSTLTSIFLAQTDKWGSLSSDVRSDSTCELSDGEQSDGRDDLKCQIKSEMKNNDSNGLLIFLQSSKSDWKECLHVILPIDYSSQNDLIHFISMVQLIKHFQINVKWIAKDIYFYFPNINTNTSGRNAVESFLKWFDNSPKSTLSFSHVQSSNSNQFKFQNGVPRRQLYRTALIFMPPEDEYSDSLWIDIEGINDQSPNVDIVSSFLRIAELQRWNCGFRDMWDRVGYDFAGFSSFHPHGPYLERQSGAYTVRLFSQSESQNVDVASVRERYLRLIESAVRDQMQVTQQLHHSRNSYFLTTVPEALERTADRQKTVGKRVLPTKYVMYAWLSVLGLVTFDIPVLFFCEPLTKWIIELIKKQSSEDDKTMEQIKDSSSSDPMLVKQQRQDIDCLDSQRLEGSNKIPSADKSSSDDMDEIWDDINNRTQIYSDSLLNIVYSIYTCFGGCILGFVVGLTLVSQFLKNSKAASDWCISEGNSADGIPSVLSFNILAIISISVVVNFLFIYLITRFFENNYQLSNNNNYLKETTYGRFNYTNSISIGSRISVLCAVLILTTVSMSHVLMMTPWLVCLGLCLLPFDPSSILFLKIKISNLNKKKSLVDSNGNKKLNFFFKYKSQSLVLLFIFISALPFCPQVVSSFQIISQLNILSYLFFSENFLQYSSHYLNSYFINLTSTSSNLVSNISKMALTQNCISGSNPFSSFLLLFQTACAMGTALILTLCQNEQLIVTGKYDSSKSLIFEKKGDKLYHFNKMS